MARVSCPSWASLKPQAWLTDVLERMVSGRTKAHELERLLPWNWKSERLAAAVHA
jgi:transposase